MTAGQPRLGATAPFPEKTESSTMVPKRPPNEKSETGMFEKNVLTSAGLPDGMRHAPLDRGIQVFFVPRRCFTKKKTKTGIG